MARTFSKQTVNGTEYLVCDKKAREDITSEATTRATAISAEETARATAILAEETARANADEDMKIALKNTGVDVLTFGGAPETYEGGGITATKIDKYTYKFQGTITRSDFIAWYMDTSNFPAWLVKGKKYIAVIEGASENNNNGVYFNVLGFSGLTQINFLENKYMSGAYIFSIPGNFSGGLYIRAGWLGENSGHVVDETITFHIYSCDNEYVLQAGQVMHQFKGNPAVYTSCDDVPTGAIVFVSSIGGVLEIPDFPYNSPGTLVCFSYESFRIQFAFPFNTAPNRAKCRSEGSNGWTAWETIGENELKYIPEYTYTSCNNISEQCYLFVGSSGGVLTIPDAPFICMLMTLYVNSNIVFQIALPWDTSNKIKYRTKTFNGWTSWIDIGSGGSTVTIVQEVSRDTYNNTYSGSVSPTITTDTNGWLQPVDTESSDETGKTDMTNAIMAMLNSTGYCHLAPGIFYVSGNIDMPAGSMIEGCGKQTIIRLLQTVTSGYIVRMNTKSTLKNVCLSGGYSDLDISTSSIGGRRGINYIGNRDGQSTGVTPATCTLCQIEGCWFENLDSGFYGYNAGGGLQEGVEVSNCYFSRCKAGINIDYWTEYCKFVNCVIFQCYYGCINNGGNNVFMNCTFHGVIGFMIDNSSGTKTNNAHGSVIGCTFNHIDNMNNPSELGKGIGIKVLDVTAGFLFANCQLWYGRVYIENSQGIQITGCEFGGLGNSSYPAIETAGNGMVFIDSCLFQSAPSLDFSSPVKITNCWTYNGTAVSA